MTPLGRLLIGRCPSSLRGAGSAHRSEFGGVLPPGFSPCGHLRGTTVNWKKDADFLNPSGVTIRGNRILSFRQHCDLAALVTVVLDQETTVIFGSSTFPVAIRTLPYE